MKNNRLIHATAGFITMLAVGIIYSWSVFQLPISKTYPEWGMAELSFPFTLALCGFCIGGLCAGILQRKIPARIIVFVCALFFCGSFIIVSNAESLIGLYIGFGVLAGMSSGAINNCVMNATTAWYPECPGTISGILTMGFGMSSFIINKIFAAITPSYGEGWRNVFFYMGIILFSIVLICGIFITKPENSKAFSEESSEKSNEEIPPQEMMKKSSFWLYIIWLAVILAAGLAIISQGSVITLPVALNLEIDNIATLVSLISIFSGLGRIIFGVLFDKIKYRKTFILGSGLFVAATLLLILSILLKSTIILTAGFVFTGLSYGCLAPTTAAFARLFYGNKYYSINYPIINMTILFSSFASTAAGMIYDILQSYIALIAVFAVLLAAVTFLSLLIKKDDPKAIKLS